MVDLALRSVVSVEGVLQVLGLRRLVAGGQHPIADRRENGVVGPRVEVRAQEDILKPMRRSDCERITSEFFSKLRRAFEEGHLIIQDRNDDVFV